MEGTVGSTNEVVAPAAEQAAAVPEAPALKRSWARILLMGLFCIHAVALGSAMVLATPDLPVPSMTWLFAALNAVALAGLASRTRLGFFVALGFVVAAVARYAWLLQIEDADYPGLIVGIAAAVFCLTDPALRREHGIAA